MQNVISFPQLIMIGQSYVSFVILQIPSVSSSFFRNIQVINNKNIGHPFLNAPPPKKPNSLSTSLLKVVQNVKEAVKDVEYSPYAEAHAR